MQYEEQLNVLACSYVKLALQLERLSTGYVDAFYGDKKLFEAVEASPISLNEVFLQATALAGEIGAVMISQNELKTLSRRNFLQKQTSALAARAQMLSGIYLPFDEESQVLYDTVAPKYTHEYYLSLLDSLESKLPGKGSIQQRYQHYKSHFVIPKDKVIDVFATTIKHVQAITHQYIKLPDDEGVEFKFVNNKSWSAYNRYLGHNRSEMSLNVDFPMYIDRAVNLSTHECYPGHHVYNCLLDNKLFQQNGWQEFSICTLFNPLSFIAEGTAEYAIDMVFTKDQRLAFEQNTIFPLAGLDPELAEQYYAINEVLGALNYANNDIARQYLSGEQSSEQTIQLMKDLLLLDEKPAIQRFNFMKHNRSYVINYNWAKELVKQHITSKVTDINNISQHWSVFADLLCSTTLPSQLTNKITKSPRSAAFKSDRAGY